MEKLVELLNEFDKLENSFTHYKKGWYGDCVYENYLPSISHLILISKPYGFIWWLVENDKIDLKEFHRLCGIINQDSEYWNGTPQDYEQVIMYLSISDTPIEDLVSLLK